MSRKTTKIIMTAMTIILITFFIQTSTIAAPDISFPQITIEGTDNPSEVAGSLQILFLLTLLTIAPSILIMMTSFTRIVIVLSFVRNALGTQQMPPNQILVGLALFLTFFLMAPVMDNINTNAIRPYIEEAIGQSEAIDNAMAPLREFMFKQTRNKDLALFVNLSQIDAPEDLSDIPNHVLIPSFVISELKTAFQIGFIIYIPFIVVDMVVASTLMSMGMMMLPPVMISLPFKILLFIMVDGWNLVIRTIITGFR